MAPPPTSVCSLSLSPLPILRHSVSEQVLAELRRRIVAGEIAGDAPFPEAHYAQLLGVSRVPVREAVMQLERDGLLWTNGRGRMVVRVLTARDYREIAAVRMQLEGRAARLAAAVRTREDLEALRLNIAAFDASTTPEALAQLDVAYHETLCVAARDSWLIRAWQAIRWPFEALLVRNFRNYVTATSLGASKVSTGDHARILEAIKNGESLDAERLLCQHIARWEEWAPTP